VFTRRDVPYALIALALTGLAISLYLVTTHYGDRPIACAGVGDCEAVNSSAYASIGGVPVSLLGVGLYASLAGLAAYWALDPSDDRRMVAYWGLALSGAGYAAYLTYVELEILHAICVWCVASATLLVTSLVLATSMLFVMPETSGSTTIRRVRGKPVKHERALRAPE
jgi:uncharacterized membrane protein